MSVGSPPLPGDVEAARKANGATNVAVIEAAMEAKVGRAVVVGATMPPWLDKVAEGYALGKRDAFEALGGSFALGGGAVVVKPSAIYGTRHTGIGLPDPAGAGHGAAVLRAEDRKARDGLRDGPRAVVARRSLGAAGARARCRAHPVVAACLEEEYEAGLRGAGRG